MSLSIDAEIRKLEREINATKNFTHAINDGFIERIYKLKTKHFEHENNYRVLEHLEEYIHFQNKKLDSFKYTLLTLVNLIFIPLGVLVGYFGMNFASMGVPDVKSGILSVGSGEWLVAVIGMSIIVTIIVGYAYFFGFHLPN